MKRAFSLLAVAVAVTGCGSSPSESSASSSSPNTPAAAPILKAPATGPKALNGIQGTAAAQNADSRFGTAANGR